MQKKLLIYETTHYETLPAIVELALEKFEQVTIYVVSRDIPESCEHFPVFKSKKIKWVAKPEEQANWSFIKQLFQELTNENYSHFLINSLDHNLYYFSLQLSGVTRKIHTVLNVHTIHDYTTTRFNSILNISESIAKKRFYRLIKNHRVLAPAMPAYLKSRLNEIEVEYIPGMFYRSFPLTEFAKSPFRIVVPGAVEKKRREYESIPQVISFLAERLGRDQKIELVILGNSNSSFGKELKMEIRDILSPSISLIVFDKDVAYDTYSSFYSSANIIWAPIRLNMESIRGVPEINGLSNSAGFIVDFIHYAHPSLLPADIKFDEKLDQLFFRYINPEDAADQLLRLINEPGILHIREWEIRAKCSSYTAEKFRPAFNRLMNL
jgi:hypothetical protein